MDIDKSRLRALANKLSACDQAILYDEGGGDEPISDEDVALIVVALRTWSAHAPSAGEEK